MLRKGAPVLGAVLGRSTKTSSVKGSKNLPVVVILKSRNR